MEPYHQIFPDSPEPLMTLVLNRKTGSIPKGTYGFIECYCTDACDCRRVVLLVVNEKNKQKAVINFGFDQQGPFAGPYLDMSNAQSDYAAQILDLFVQSLNTSSQWLDRLYRHYKEVRAKVEGKRYRGKPLPKPGQLIYRATPPPDLEAEMLESLKKLKDSGRLRSEPQAAMPDVSHIPGAVRVHGVGPRAREEETIATLVRRHAEVGATAPIETVMTLHDDLRRYLMENEEAGEELARFLPEVCRQSPQDDASINAALRLLYDALNVFEEQMEMERPGARERMERLQKGLAQHVFQENEDADLWVAVANILVQSRVEIIPQLREGAGRIMIDEGGRTDLHDLSGEDIMTGISRSLESMGVSSPFEGAREIMQLLTMTEPDLQVAVIGEMLSIGKPLLRDISALMLFSADDEVRMGTAQLLASREGADVSPETLRRLIVTRNWLPEMYRKHVDQAVTKARKARVECATLPRPASMTVYATAIDGSGEQSFQIIVPDGMAFSRCTIVVKQGEGVADASVFPLKGKGEVTTQIGLLKKEPKFVESSPEHLDLRICHALAEGIRLNRVPTQWLLLIAELLGRDKWRPVHFDPARELLQLWEELESERPKTLEESEASAALEESGKWELSGSVLPEWYVDDDEAAKVLDRTRDRRKGVDVDAALDAMLDDVLESRRALWLERLVVTAQLLKSCSRPPIPWHRMFHVAQAVADDTLPLRQIPLMVNIAVASAKIYTGHR